MTQTTEGAIRATDHPTMVRIEAAVEIAAPVERVWDVLLDWEGQAGWMVDARSVTVLSTHREGLDVRVRVRTGLLPPFVVTDDLVTTEWYEHSTIGVRHLGRLIRGGGAFELEAVGPGTRLVWWEEIEAPLGALGAAVASTVIVPIVNRVFRASLSRLAVLCER